MFSSFSIDFSYFFTMHSAAMLIIDPQTGNILDANNSALDFYGYSIDEIKRLKIFDINQLPPNEIKKRMTDVENIQRKEFIFPHKLKDNSIRYVKVFSSLYPCNGKNLLISIIEDVTESFEKDRIIAEEREKFKIVADFSYGWEYWIDENMNLKYISKGSEEICGYSAEEFYNDPDILKRMVHPDFKKIYDIHVEETHHKKRNIKLDLEYKIITKDGKERWIYHVCRPIYSSGGKFLGRRVSNRDITHKKEFIEALESEMNIFNYGPVVSIIWSPEYGWPVKYVSDNIKNVLGYEKDFFLSPDFRYNSIIYPNDLEKISSEVSQKIESGETNFFQEYRVKNGSGQYVWLYDVTKLIRNSEGKVVEIRGYLLDNTTKKKLEEDLKKEKEVLSYIIEAADIGTWQWNIKKKELILNNKWANMLGYTLEELSPVDITTWEKLCHPSDLEKAYNMIERHIKGEIPSYSCELRMRSKDGDYKWILDKGKIVSYEENGNPELFFGIHIDIDNIKKLQIKASKYLDYLNRAQTVSKTGSWHLDIKNGKLWWSKQTYDIFKIPYDYPIDLEYFFKLVHPDDRQFVLSEWNNALKGKPYDIEHRIISNGDILWVNEKAELIFDENGLPIEAIGTVKDITQQKYYEKEIADENLLINSLIDLVPGYLWYIDGNGIIKKQNRNSIDNFGNKVGEICSYGIFCGKFIPNIEEKYLGNSEKREDLKCKFCIAGEALKNQNPFNIEIEYDGKSYILWWVPVNDNEYIHYMVDITQQKEIENTLRELSITDPLTKFYNRRYITEKIEREINLASRSNRKFSLIMYDIDHFKSINDNYGHLSGDNVLIKISDVVKKRVRKADIPARWGGEEFMILLPETNLDNATKLSEELRKLFTLIKFKENFTITASFGVTEYIIGDTVDSITKRVDELMYQAKEAGRNNVVSG